MLEARGSTRSLKWICTSDGAFERTDDAAGTYRIGVACAKASSGSIEITIEKQNNLKTLSNLMCITSFEICEESPKAA